MANSVVCEVVGIVTIKIRTHDGRFCTLNDVRHVALMTKNPYRMCMQRLECGVKGVLSGVLCIFYKVQCYLLLLLLHHERCLRRI